VRTRIAFMNLAGSKPGRVIWKHKVAGIQRWEADVSITFDDGHTHNDTVHASEPCEVYALIPKVEQSIREAGRYRVAKKAKIEFFMHVQVRSS